MKEFWNIIKPSFITVKRWLDWFLGSSDNLLYALVAFVVVDYATSVMCAATDKKLSSEIGFKGIEKSTDLLAGWNR